MLYDELDAAAGLGGSSHRHLPVALLRERLYKLLLDWLLGLADDTLLFFVDDKLAIREDLDYG